MLVVIPLKFAVTHFISQQKERQVNQWIQKNAEFASWFADVLDGISEIRLWNLYGKEIQRLKKKQKELLELNKSSRLLDTYNQSADAILQWIMTSLIYLIGGYSICNRTLTIGGLTAFLTYSSYVIGPIAIVFNLKMLFAQIMPSFHRLEDLYAEEEEQIGTKSGRTTEWEQKIEFRHVDYSYTEYELLKDINFTIHKGEKIAIIGDNGCGKSTLISLLLRFREPQSGEIVLDGKSISNMDINAYRELFGVVTQDLHLFHDTIYENIIMGMDVNQDKLQSVLERFGFDDILKKYTEGLQSVIEDDGANLSGGERKKIALIRAVLKDTPILVFDEATANLDQEYSRFVQELIHQELEDKTIIFITHDPNQIQGMDRVYNMSEKKYIKK